MELPGYTQVRGNTPANTNYRETQVPWRLVLHTVEGDPPTEAAMISTARSHANGPHLWVSPRLGVKIQTVPLDKCARALARPRGAPETNHMRAIQVEIFGFAGQTHTWPAEWNIWLGENVVAPIQRALSGALNLDYVERTYGAGEGIVLAVSSSPIRHDVATWRRCNWVTSHQRVPSNDHWDAGAINMGLILSSAKYALGQAPPPPPATPSTSSEEDELMSVAEHLKQHMNAVGEGVKADLRHKIDLLGFGQSSFILNNQKTGVLFRKAGTTAPWYGMMGGRVIGPMDFDTAIEFKKLNEISENSVEVADPLFSVLIAPAEVVLADKSVEEIAEAVSSVDAAFLNETADATAQKIAQGVLAQLGDRISADFVDEVAQTLIQAGERLRSSS